MGFEYTNKVSAWTSQYEVRFLQYTNFERLFWRAHKPLVKQTQYPTDLNIMADILQLKQSNDLFWITVFVLWFTDVCF